MFFGSTNKVYIAYLNQVNVEAIEQSQWGINPIHQQALTKVHTCAALNVCFQLGIGEVNSAHENSSEFFCWGASEKYATNEEMDREEKHECQPNDVSCHLVNEQCRKNSQEPHLGADKQCRQRSHKPFLRYPLPPGLPRSKEILVPVHHVQGIIMQLILVDSDSEDNTEEPNDTRLLRSISPRSSRLSSVTFLQKAPAQGMTARMFHISVVCLNHSSNVIQSRYHTLNGYKNDYATLLLPHFSVRLHYKPARSILHSCKLFGCIIYDIIPTKIWFSIFYSESLPDLEWSLTVAVHAQQRTIFKVLLLTLLQQMTIFTIYEISLGRISGPCLPSMCPDVHINRFGVIPKNYQ